MVSIARAANFEDLRQLAKRRLPSFLFKNIDGGAGDGVGKEGNIEAFAKWRLWTRVLSLNADVDQQSSLFGRTYGSSFGISATGMGPLLRPGLDADLAREAAAADIPFTLSTFSGLSIEKAMETAPRHVWFQLYAAKDRAITRGLVERARDAGAPVLVMTVDYPISPRSEDVRRSGITLPPQRDLRVWSIIVAEALKHPRWTFDFLRAGGFPMLGNLAPFAGQGANSAAVMALYRSQYPARLSWSDLEYVRQIWPRKLVVKGITHPADARAAVDAGADAVTVSNHGGNAFDRSAAALDALPAVVAAVGSRVPVLFDGGIRRGSDVVVARCLGAQFCFVGRPTLYGAAAAGAAGAARAIQLLRDGIQSTMVSTGCASVADFHRDRLFSHDVEAPVFRRGLAVKPVTAHSRDRVAQPLATRARDEGDGHPMTFGDAG